MKKLLSILGAVSLTALASTTVVACGQTETKNPEALDGKEFSVTLDSLTEPKIEVKDDKKLPQYQWGDQTIGFLYSTLWSINQKDENYPIQNAEVASYLTKGESLTRGDDSGANVKINDKSISEIVNQEKEDWHTITLAKDDVVVFNIDILSYKGAEVIKTTPVEITINIA